MSTKTIKQRIALVAVSALTAGLFSVVSAPVANAAVGATTANSLWLATTNSTTGVPIGVAAGGDVVLATDAGVGFIAVTSAPVALKQVVQSDGTGLLLGQVGTANALATAKLRFNVGTPAAIASLVVSGGTITTGTVKAASGTLTFNGSATAMAGSAIGDFQSAVVTPNTGVTSMTVSSYQGAGITPTAPTNGTLIGQWVITIVSSSLSGAFSAADSSVYQQAAQAKGTACQGISAFDVVASVGNGRAGCIWVNPKDAYGVAVSAGSLTASATNGAKVAIGASPTGAEGYTASLSFASATSAANTYVSVFQGTANTGGSTVVTIAWQGVVIGTKTITFQGDIAKLTFVAASSNTTYKNGAVAADAPRGIVWAATDALGQVVDLAAGNVSISDATGAMTPAVLDVSSAAAAFVTQSTTTGVGAGTMTIAANALVGAGTYRLKVTNAAGTDIKSDVINAVVSGGAATFTAAWDKASYSPGEIAELTITAKDSGGRGLAQGIAFGTGAAITVNTDGLTTLTTECAALNTATVVTAAGARVCKFAVKNTAGAYAYSVAVTTSTSQSAVTGSVKIAESAGTVSNAQVLQSIVALIASINKQIQALQKLILKR
jgi:hypothetical protein